MLLTFIGLSIIFAGFSPAVYGAPKATISATVKKNIGRKAVVFQAILTVKSSNGMTVNKDGQIYTLVTDNNTQFRRKFWGKSNIDEMNIGDNISVVGKWADDGKTTINARIIKDLSIQKRNGVFVGTIKSFTNNGFILDSLSRGSLTVNTTVSTLIINRKGLAIGPGDLLAGHRVRVRGVWDSKLGTLDEVTNIKDYSLPIQGVPVATSSAKTQ